MADGSLEIERLAKRYDRRWVIRDLGVVVDAGQCLAVVGPSGSGKTTLLRLVAGLEAPDAGEIRIGGRTAVGSGTMIPPHRRGVGMVFQDLALWPHLRAWENVAFMIQDGNGRKARQSRARELLDGVRMADHHDAYPHTLSRGEQQRVALARAIAAAPRLLLLDEPFSSVDPELGDHLRSLVQELRHRLGLTLICVTHSLEKLEGFADRVVRMSNGTLIEERPEAALSGLNPAIRPLPRHV